MWKLIEATKKHQSESAWVQLFARFIGIAANQSKLNQSTLDAYLEVFAGMQLSAMHSAHGGAAERLSSPTLPYTTAERQLLLALRPLYCVDPQKYIQRLADTAFDINVVSNADSRAESRGENRSVKRLSAIKRRAPTNNQRLSQSSSKVAGGDDRTNSSNEAGSGNSSAPSEEVEKSDP